MTIIAVLFNIIGAVMILFAGIAFEDKEAPRYTCLTLFVFWFIFNAASMLMLNN